MEAVKTNKPNTKKEAMLEALEKSLGIVSTACKMVDMGRTTHYQWMKEDTDYKKAVDSIQDRTARVRDSREEAPLVVR